MVGGVGVVTDSTADLPLALADELGLRVVPMTVTFRDRTFISRVTISDEEFYERLAASAELPTTAQPNPAWFEEAYADCADEGLDAAVSIHVSKQLSGTVSSAMRAAEDAPLPVTVMDSRQVGGGLALMALAAQKVAQSGGSADGVVQAARRVRDELVSGLVVDTMENLRRGGRVSGTQAFVGNVLKVKPILAVRDGRVEPVDKARTLTRALDRLVDRVADAVGDRDVDVVVTHALVPERADDLLGRLRERVAVASHLTTVFGPVLATHTGPGAVAVAAVPVDPAIGPLAAGLATDGDAG
jgi:DegV family protein with EDD domain